MMGALGVVMPVVFRGSMHIKDAHCTLMYLGESDQVHIDRRKVEAATERLRSQCSPILVPVQGVEVFGKGHMTVLILAETTLASYRKFLERELRRDGIVSASEYAYRPHVTINKHEVSSEPVLPWPNYFAPSYVWVDRPTLWWNDNSASDNVK